MKKRIMVIGPSQSGKSTLVNRLNDTDRPLKKTQDIIYGFNTIDTPGSYIENASMYKYLIATAQDASHVLVLVDASRSLNVYPPGFAKCFTCPVTGVVTKIDLAQANRDVYRQQLESIGIPEPYFWVSLNDNSGVDALKNHLFGVRG